MSRKDSAGRVLNKGESERISNGKHLGYVFRYTDDAGISCQIYAKTLKELRVKEQAAKKESVSVRNRRATVSDVARMYLDARRVDVEAGLLRQSTLNSYEYSWSIFFDGSRLSKIRISSVSTNDIQSHYKKMLSDGLTIATCKTAHTVLSGIFKYAHDSGYVTQNVARGALTGISKNATQRAKASGESVVRCLTSEQRAYLMFALSSDRYKHYAPIIRFLLHTGLRIGELCGLTIDDVCEDAVYIRRCLKYCHDAEGHMSFVINPPKSAAGRRTVLLSEAARADLRAYKVLNVHSIDSVSNVSNFAFCTPKGHPLSYRAANKILKQLVSESNGQLPDGLTCHWLRHTFVCDAIDAGVPIPAVSAYVGHETTDVTMRVYYTCRPSAMTSAVAILDTIDKQNRKQNSVEIRD